MPDLGPGRRVDRHGGTTVGGLTRKASSSSDSSGSTGSNGRQGAAQHLVQEPIILAVVANAGAQVGPGKSESRLGCGRGERKHALALLNGGVHTSGAVLGPDIWALRKV